MARLTTGSSLARDASGTRFAPYRQITPGNVRDLQVAWTYRTGRRTTGAGAGVDENTPLQIGNVLYSCTPENLVTALDGDTGKPLWKFDPHAKSAEHVTCRGVGYHDIDKDSSLSAAVKASYGAQQQCRQRILVSSVDARLFALDAHTGALCRDFGEQGYVDLKKGMGPTENSKRYHPTSLPVVMGHLTVVGGWVRDIIAGEPSGAVRAFDVLTGKLAWAWDVGAPEGADTTAPAHQFALDTPNVWTVPTYDKALNLLYLPTGNGPPDYWGGDRNAVKEKYGSAIVAVDASTGKAKWVYQMVHHDVWDFDLPSQPVLYDMKNAQGEKSPVLIQTTKTGHIFVLDRRTGKPFTEVQERAVPTAPAAHGEHLSPTQPYSVGMPVIGADPLTEKSMWGVTTFDQLYCRILFKDSVYVGPFTPPTEKPYIEWPSLLGGMNWGGISIDENTGMMFVNDMRMPLRMSLVTRKIRKNSRSRPTKCPAPWPHPPASGRHLWRREDRHHPVAAGCAVQQSAVWQHERHRPEYAEAGVAGAAGHGQGYGAAGHQDALADPAGHAYPRRSDLDGVRPRVLRRHAGLLLAGARFGYRQGSVEGAPASGRRGGPADLQVACQRQAVRGHFRGRHEPFA